MSRTLREQSDRLNTILASVENILNRLGLGVESFVRFDETTEFGYARNSNGWGLSVRVSGLPRPLRESKREYKIAVVPLLPLIFRQLERDSQKLLAELEAATALAQEMIAAMNDAMSECAM